MHDATIAGTLALVTIAALNGGYRFWTGSFLDVGLAEGVRYAEVLSVSRHGEQENQGYQVTYLLDGHEQVIRLDYDPGKRLVIEDGSLMLRKLRTLQRQGSRQ